MNVFAVVCVCMLRAPGEDIISVVCANLYMFCGGCVVLATVFWRGCCCFTFLFALIVAVVVGCAKWSISG